MRRKVDPAREAEKFFEGVEWMRRVNFNTHQVIRLTATDMAEPGIQPTLEELNELRDFLVSIQPEVDVQMPPLPLTGYAGFTLYDPFGDERPQDLSEFSNFAPARDAGDIYHIYDGVLQLQGRTLTGQGRELEEWLKQTWIRHGRILPSRSPRPA